MSATTTKITMPSPTKKQIITVKDIKATVPEVPLDYSFMNLSCVAGKSERLRDNRCDSSEIDIVNEDPVSGQKLNKDNVGWSIPRLLAD